MVNKSSVSLLFYLCSGSLCSVQIMNCSSSGSHPVFFFLVSLLTCWSSLPNKWAAPPRFGCCRGKMQMSVPAVSVGPRLRGRAEVSSESWLCFLSAAARSSHCGVMTLRESTKNQKEPHPNGSLCELETHTHTAAVQVTAAFVTMEKYKFSLKSQFSYFWMELMFYVIRVQQMHFTEFGGMRNKVLYLCLEVQENCSMVVRNCLITYIVISRKPPESTTKCCVPSELL